MIWFGLERIFGVGEEFFPPSLKFKQLSKHSMFSSQRKEYAYELVAARKKGLNMLIVYGRYLYPWRLLLIPYPSLFFLPVGHWVDSVSGPWWSRHPLPGHCSSHCCKTLQYYFKKQTIQTSVLSICSDPQICEMHHNALGAVSQLEDHLPQRDICLFRQVMMTKVLTCLCDKLTEMKATGKPLSVVFVVCLMSSNAKRQIPSTCTAGSCSQQCLLSSNP